MIGRLAEAQEPTERIDGAKPTKRTTSHFLTLQAFLPCLYSHIPDHIVLFTHWVKKDPKGVRRDHYHVAAHASSSMLDEKR